MLDTFFLMLMGLCGTVLILVSKLVLHACNSFEISLRSVSAFLVGVAGAWYIVCALTGDAVSLRELLLPIGVVLYVTRILWHRWQKDKYVIPMAIRGDSWLGRSKE